MEPKIEKGPLREGTPVSREMVSNALKENGLEKAKEQLSQWLDNEQRRVEKGEITNLQFNISWAELYRDAGLIEAAIGSFEQAAELAWQEHEDEIYERLQGEISKLRGE